MSEIPTFTYILNYSLLSPLSTEIIFRAIALMSVSGQLRTYAPTPPLTQHYPNLFSVDCCWVRGGVGAQSSRYRLILVIW